jgi:hypothetical protein
MKNKEKMIKLTSILHEVLMNAKSPKDYTNISRTFNTDRNLGLALRGRSVDGGNLHRPVVGTLDRGINRIKSGFNTARQGITNQYQNIASKASQFAGANPQAMQMAKYGAGAAGVAAAGYVGYKGAQMIKRKMQQRRCNQMSDPTQRAQCLNNIR